jgi:hypothetical protein
MSSSNPVTCSLAKPGKESARNCALNLLIKVMRREIIPGDEATAEVSYSPQEIEQIIYDTYPSRDSYLDKIAKVALHLSLFTRTGRVSWTFQNNIFDRSLQTTGDAGMDYLQRLLTTATDEEVFPELYLSQGFVTERDRQAFQDNMYIEHAAILAGLHEVVRRCCDSKTCSVEEMNDTYDQELFKTGSIFRTAAHSVCMTRRVKSWIPPMAEIYLPDTSPISLETNPDNEPENSLGLQEQFKLPVDEYDDSESPVSIENNQMVPIGDTQLNTTEKNTVSTPTLPGPITFDNMLYGNLQVASQKPSVAAAERYFQQTATEPGINADFSDVPADALNQVGPHRTGATTIGLATTPIIGDIDLTKSGYVSQPSRPKINRNFTNSAELRCYDVSNLVHNLATLAEGRLLELPFGSDLLDDDVQDQLFEKFRTEIGMRRYYLSTLVNQSSS